MFLNTLSEITKFAIKKHYSIYNILLAFCPSHFPLMLCNSIGLSRAFSSVVQVKLYMHNNYMYDEFDTSV